MQDQETGLYFAGMSEASGQGSREGRTRQVGNPGHRIFFDISAMLDYVGKHTTLSGIQRVVTEIIEESRNQISEDRIYLSFIDKVTQRYMAICITNLKKGTLYNAVQLGIAFGVRYPGVKLYKPFEKYKDDRLRIWFHTLKNDLRAWKGEEKYFSKRGSSISEWRNYRSQRSRSIKLSRGGAQFFSEVAQAGDHLVILDSSWSKDHQSEFRRAKDAGAIVHTFVYDLIPMIMPQTTERGIPHAFYEWLSNSITYTDQYISGSNSTNNDLGEFLKLEGVSRPLSVVQLAQQFRVKDGNQKASEVFGEKEQLKKKYALVCDVGNVSEQIREVLTVPFVLCVGTIEPRKNIWRLVQAWKLLSERVDVEVPKLVLAGRLGWLRRDFSDFMRATGGGGGYIRVCEGPSDVELAVLYKNCQFAIMPSLYEGWGLPVGEALSYGKTAVVSNSSSLPEVGGDLVEYCDPTSIQSIVEACLRLIQDPDRRKDLERRISNTKLRNWSDVTRDLLSCVAEFKAEP